MAPFDRPYTTFYWSIVSIALFCTIFELFDVEPEGHSVEGIYLRQRCFDGSLAQ